MKFKREHPRTPPYLLLRALGLLAFSLAISCTLHDWRRADSDEYVQQVLVKFKIPSTDPDTQKILKLAREITGIDVKVEQVTDTGVFLVRSKSVGVLDLVKKFMEPKYKNVVRYAEPNYRVVADAAPNDPLFSALWGLKNTGRAPGDCGIDRTSEVQGGVLNADIQAQPAWDGFTQGSHEVVVAVLDTGIDLSHRDLEKNLWEAHDTFDIRIGDVLVHCDKGTHGFNALATDPKQVCVPADDGINSHGTHIAGVIGAKGGNGFGMVGVVWDVRLLGVKVLNDAGEARMADIIKGIRFVKAVKRKFEPSTSTWVVNNSYGVLCEGSGPCHPTLLEEEIREATDLLFVASAGNGHRDTDEEPHHFPSSFSSTLPNVISVAALTNTNSAWDNTNFGRTTVDLGAPGVAICSTKAGNEFSYQTGTSAAAAYISGAAALILSRCQLPPASLKDILRKSTESIVQPPPPRIIPRGRLNVHKAFQESLTVCTP